MGCGASAPSPVPPAGAAPVVERSPADGGEAELLASWTAIAGGADQVLNSDQLRLVFEQLDRQLSDEAFDGVFRDIDQNGNGTVEFSEFVAFYQSSSLAEQKQIRALNVEAELKRRLAEGLLSTEQQQAVRDKLGVA
eukprot:COSAG02_NODE_29203_length_574_cov_0.764211_1_plen_136_part_01